MKKQKDGEDEAASTALYTLPLRSNLVDEFRVLLLLFDEEILEFDKTTAIMTKAFRVNNPMPPRSMRTIDDEEEAEETEEEDATRNKLSSNSGSAPRSIKT